MSGIVTIEVEKGARQLDVTDCVMSAIERYKLDLELDQMRRRSVPHLNAIVHEADLLTELRAGYTRNAPLSGVMARAVDARQDELQYQKRKIEKLSSRRKPLELFVERLMLVFAQLHDDDPRELQLGSKPSNENPNELMRFLIGSCKAAGVGRHADTLFKDAQACRDRWKTMSRDEFERLVAKGGP